MHPWEHSKAARLAGPVGLVALTLVGMILLSANGLPDSSRSSLGPFSVILVLVGGGSVALAYVLGAFGLGRPLAALLAPSSRSRLWLQLALGLAGTLWLSHALGLIGALSGPGVLPRIIGWLPIVIGLGLLADQLIRGPLRPERWPVLPLSSILWAPGLALLIVAAANPTGTLWGGPPVGTEYNGFDALEYHLQLPKEWAAGARLWPNDHNVYSYLPSFMEAAFLHLGALMPGGEKCNEPVARMLAGSTNDGNWVIACQYLHAAFAIIGALFTARAASVLVARVRASGSTAATPKAPEGGPPAHDRLATTLGVIVGAITLCTPWMVVVSTLPYNDAAAIALAAAGILAALDDRIPIGRRAVIAGWIVGVACGCKPTALFMAGPVVGLLLLSNMLWRRWPLAAIAGSIAGLAAIVPWLWRNWAASGNPVFPFAAALFGTGHWTSEQVERHTRNHHAPPDLHAAGRFGRLFSEEFGLTHPQWGMFLGAMIAAAALALAWKSSRRPALLLLVAIAAQCACWMVLTHLQSRFLLPIITPGALLIALAGGALATWVSRSGESRTRPLRILALIVLALIPLDQARRAVWIFFQQNDGTPNLVLVRGVGAMTGLAFEDQLAAPDERDRAELVRSLDPTQHINLIIRPQTVEDSGVYLLGGSTPLYMLAATGQAAQAASGAGPASAIIYNTTWDTPLLATLIRAAPDDPAAWTKALRARGLRYILVNFNELHRLIEQDHYYDPAVSPPDIARLVAARGAHLRSVRAWRSSTAPPLTGVELFEIDLPAPAENPAARPSLKDHLR
ncbi:MAG TPA: hypothetical protein VHC70_05020 [Phycisphaerales bacterium]|nr:hypothetical protein [Phycisphaerales bacterium]